MKRNFSILRRPEGDGSTEWSWGPESQGFGQIVLYWRPTDPAPDDVLELMRHRETVDGPGVAEPFVPIVFRGRTIEVLRIDPIMASAYFGVRVHYSAPEGSGYVDSERRVCNVPGCDRAREHDEFDLNNLTGIVHCRACGDLWSIEEWNSFWPAPTEESCRTQ